MVKEYTYSPHVDFYIDMIDREHSYDMGSFHTHHKYELYYEVEGARRYFIEDSAYIVNAGNVILIGENQIHKTGSVGDGPTSRIVCNFSREYLQEISGAFPEIDLFSFMSEENNHLLSNITVKQQNYRGGKDRLYDKRAFPASVQRCHRAFAPAVPPIFQAGKQTGK